MPQGINAPAGGRVPAQAKPGAGGGTGVLHRTRSAGSTPALGNRTPPGAVWDTSLPELAGTMDTCKFSWHIVHGKNESGFEPLDPQSELAQTLRRMSGVH